MTTSFHLGSSNDAAPDARQVFEQLEQGPPIVIALVFEQEVDQRLLAGDLHSVEHISITTRKLGIDERDGQRGEGRPIDERLQRRWQDALQLGRGVLGLRKRLMEERIVGRADFLGPRFFGVALRVGHGTMGFTGANEHVQADSGKTCIFLPSSTRFRTRLTSMFRWM
jgi:hypothetical protein